MAMRDTAERTAGQAAALLGGIRDRVCHPATIRELMRVLKIARSERYGFRRQIARLVDAGDLVRIRGNRYGLADRVHLVAGRLAVNPRGFGFVSPDHGGDDVYVAGVDLGEALHGDRVTVRVERAGGRAEGRVVEVLERANAVVVGRYEVDDAGAGVVVPFDERVNMDLRIPAGGSIEAEAGQMVVAAVERWPARGRGPIGRLVEVLGRLDDPGVDTAIVIRKHRLPDGEDPAAAAEADRLGDAVAPADLEGRTDFRGLPTVTIDGETARDFDDAVTLERLPGGRRRLGVHVADVAHYVVEGSALDESARRRGTSVYFPERAIHMFPAGLATGLCSLNPGVDRLVHTCLMDVDDQGRVERYELHDGVICSDARMTYADVDAILTARDAAVRERHATLVPMFESMDALAQRLAARRKERGSLDFDLRETRLVLDEAGAVEGIVAAERNVAHRIIEEFMLIANETVAGHLEARGVAALFRVHEPPDPAKVAEFDDFASTLGYRLGAPPGGAQPRHFQRLLARLAGAPVERPVALLMLRTMQKAHYDAVNIGHFGLASEVYTHFTSPIRRYPDLVVHPPAAGVAAGPDSGGAGRRARRRTAGERAACVGHGTAGRGRRARGRPVEEGPLHGGQGRRRVHRLRRRGDPLRALRRADRALRRRTGARLRDGRRPLPVRGVRSRAPRRDDRQGLPVGRSRRRAGDARRPRAAADRPRRGGDTRCGPRLGAEPRAAPRPPDARPAVVEVSGGALVAAYPGAELTP